MDIAGWDVIFFPGRFQTWQSRSHSPGVGLAISEDTKDIELIDKIKTAL
jgi:hypothetical protein